MPYKMKPLPDDIKLEDLFTHDSMAYRQIARIFFNGHAKNTRELAQEINMSLGSVLMAVKVFKAKGLIHINGWTKEGKHPTTVLPIYRAGKREDAPRPPPKSATQSEGNKKHRQSLRNRLLDEANKYEWKGIAEALVPQRTVEEVAEVNRLYLNWISEGVYG
jgi:DNA-binding transcriptional MocR family regulator